MQTPEPDNQKGRAEVGNSQNGGTNLPNMVILLFLQLWLVAQVITEKTDV